MSDLKAQMRKGIGSVIATQGSAHNGLVTWMTNELGAWDGESEKHMISCKVKTITDLVEGFEWTESGYGAHENHKGVRASVSCECGRVDGVMFVVDEATVSTLLVQFMMEA